MDGESATDAKLTNKQTMSSVFSIDEFSDPFWQSPPPLPSTASAMNRSESEWALEKFLEEVSASASSSASDTNTAAPSVVSQASTSSKHPENGEEDVVEIKQHQIAHNSNLHPVAHMLNHNLTAPIGSEDYRALLKSKLDLACAAVAMSRDSNLKPEDFSSTVAEDQRLAAKNIRLESQAFCTDHGSTVPQIGVDGGSLGIPALPAMQKKQEVQARQTTSDGSSGEDSDDDDLEGDTETNENMDASDAKRVRRMQSNRESARRSRRRKQEQLNELETQVSGLRDKRTTLLSLFTDINQKCDDAAVDHRILKADIETLRAKVKMAEEQVKRVPGLNTMLLPRSNVPSPGMPFVGGSRVDASANVAVPMQPSSYHFFQQPVHNITSAAPHLQTLNDSFPNSTLDPLTTNPQNDNRTSNISGMTSTQPTDSGQSMAAMPYMQQVQKQIGPTVGPAGPLPACEVGFPRLAAKDDKKK